MGQRNPIHTMLITIDEAGVWHLSKSMGLAMVAINASCKTSSSSRDTLCMIALVAHQWLQFDEY